VVTAVPWPTATLVGNLARITINNTLSLTVKTANAACAVAGNCEIVDDHDASILPVIGDTNSSSGVTVATVVTQAQTFTARVKNGAQDATFVSSTGLPIATRPAPFAVVSTSATTVARGTQISLTVKSTDADCTVAGNCEIVDDVDSTVLNVVGDTNSVAGVTVSATVDQSKTYTARVKASLFDTVFVSSSGRLVTAI
jgi:hypothetical protein